MLGSNVPDELSDENGFPYSSTTKETYLSTLWDRADEVDNFNTCFKDFSAGCLLGESRCFAVDGIGFGGLHFTCVINRVSGNVEHSPKHPFAYRNLDGFPS